MNRTLSLLLFLILFACAAFAQQTNTIYLLPGVSREFVDPVSSQKVNVMCEPPSTSPLSNIVSKSTCQIRFNPVGNSCGHYIIYKDDEAFGDCGDLEQIDKEVQYIFSKNICSPKLRGACKPRFNPVGNSCGRYVIYNDDGAISDCLTDLPEVTATTQKLIAMGFCPR